MAIWEFSHNVEFSNKIKYEFASYLHERKYFEEAGLMYKQAGFYDQAINSFKETSNFQMLYSVTLSMDVAEDKLKDITIDYVTKLDEKKLYKEAGFALADNNFGVKELQEKAIDFLIRAGEYFYAIQKCLSWKNKDLSQIKKGAILAYSLKSNDLLKRTNEYKEKLVRLKVVQENKKLIPGVIKPGMHEVDMETMSQSQFSDLS